MTVSSAGDLPFERAGRALPVQRGVESRAFAALDLGASKIACLIGVRTTSPTGKRGARILGAAACKAEGVQGGVPVNLEAAEACVRRTVDMAERMAEVTVRDAVVTGGFKSLAACTVDVGVDLGGREIERTDVRDALRGAVDKLRRPGRTLLHAEECGCALDNGVCVEDPTGLFARRLSVQVLGVDLEDAAQRNAAIVAERAQLGVARLAPGPLMAASVCLEHDEAALGAVLIDMGARTTSFAYMKDYACSAAGVLPVGGEHVTQDMMVGLSMSRDEAERLKMLRGAATAAARLTTTDGLDSAADLADASVRDSVLAGVVGARIEETFELLDAAFRDARIPASARVVLTGGASQLTGAADSARRVLRRRTRLAAPKRPPGGPDMLRDPAFAAVTGLFLDEAARAKPKRRATPATPGRGAETEEQKTVLRKVASALFRGL